jgi:dihydrofolate reductase
MWNQMTADGYFAGPDGNLDWIVPDEEFDREVAEGIERSGTGPTADTILFRRRTYEQFEGFWPGPRFPQRNQPPWRWRRLPGNAGHGRDAERGDEARVLQDPERSHVE